MVSKDGLKADQEKVKIIREFSKPTTKRAVKSFLGMINQYRRFVPNLGKIIAPLHELEKDFIWNQTHEEAFKNAKEALANACILNYPTATDPFVLICDASDIVSGAVLEQTINGENKPIAFMSRKFPKTESNYSAFDKELSAIFHAIKYFRHFIEGRKVQIYTDHKPLITAFTKNDHQSPRQSRMFSFIAEFSSQLFHISGIRNVVADALSRVEAITTTVTAKQIRDEQMKDEEVTLAQGKRTFNLVEIEPGTRLVCKIEQDSVRPLIPKTLRRDIFESYHQLSHGGQKIMRKMIGQRYYWSTMITDIDDWVRTCSQCQMAKVTKHTTIPPVQIEVPKRRFSHIHVDIVGPLKISNNHRYLLTIVDRFTRWPEAIPLVNIDAKSVVSQLINGWISRFGIPDIITTDRGLQFQSELFSTLTEALGSSHIKTAAYNPRANGLVERFHRQLKDSLRATSTDDKWYVDLPVILMALRSSIKTDIGLSPAELVYGDKLRLPADILPPGEEHASIQQCITMLKQKHTPPQTRISNNVKTHIPKELFTSEYIYIRKDSQNTPLGLLRTGPFKVLSRTPNNVTIQTNHGPDTIAWHRVTPARLGKRVTFNIPKPRGRPRRGEM